ncbi:MAG: translation initiation factor IF-2 subunit beta [Promethearchaeati archaeon SRVP18_Atabeyarchaeia-1]
MGEYDYEHLLDRARSSVPEKLFAKDRFDVPLASIFPEGSRTFVLNFKEICDTLNRDPNQLMKFLLRELATSGLVEGNRAVFQGKFSDSTLNDLIKRYTKDYVLCPLCGQPDTTLKKEGRVTILVCDACGARNPVRPT